MIIRTLENRIVVTSQLDHAWASGELVHALTEEFVDEDGRDLMAALTAHHDDGWEQWEHRAIKESSALPKNFTDLEEEEHAEIWRCGIALAEERFGAYAAATLARHAAELGGDGTSAKEIEFGKKSTDLLRKAFPDDDPVVRDWKLERAFRVLRFCDLLTLAPCAGWSQELTECLVTESGQRVDIRLQEKIPFTLHLDPWPFTFNRVEVRIPVLTLENEKSWAGLADAFLAGKRELQTLVLSPSD